MYMRWLIHKINFIFDFTVPSWRWIQIDVAYIITTTGPLV